MKSARERACIRVRPRSEPSPELVLRCKRSLGPRRIVGSARICACTCRLLAPPIPIVGRETGEQDILHTSPLDNLFLEPM